MPESVTMTVRIAGITSNTNDPSGSFFVEFQGFKGFSINRLHAGFTDVIQRFFQREPANTGVLIRFVTRGLRFIALK